MLIRKGFKRPIIAQPMRTFPTLSAASRFIDVLTRGKPDFYRFNIQQTAPDAWQVSRVIGGGV